MGQGFLDFSLLRRQDLGRVAAPLTPEDRARNRVRLRTQILTASAASYGIDGLLLLGFARAGTVPYWVPVLFLTAAWLSCALFYWRFAHPTRLAAKDPYLATQQLAAAAAIQLAGLVLVPQLTFYFMLMLFLVFGISSLRVRTAPAVAAWIAVVVIAGAALLVSRNVPWLPQATPAERVLVWLCFATALGRSMLLASVGRSVRDALRRLNAKLHSALQDVRERDVELEHQRATLEAQVVERTEEMRLAKESAEKASHVKSQFLAVMSHELRTPMNAVLGMTDLLQRTSLTEQQRVPLGHASTAGRSLLGIIEDVLDLSRIEAGRTSIVVAAFELRPVMQEIVTLFDQTARDCQLSLDLVVDPRLPAWLAGDAGRIRQILINLVGNALKFTDRGGVCVQVAPLNGQIRWSVTDSGPGIDPAFLPHIYEAFSQEDASATRRFGGIGLGLAIVKRLVDAMGGSIAIDSRLGEGTSFFVDLPFAPAVTSRATEVSAAVAAPAAGSASRGQHARILIVEDNATNREYMKLLLEGYGHELFAAADGLQALEYVADHPFDLVLMDKQMPGLDGLQTTERIRGLEEVQGRARSAIIAVSAHVMEKSRREFLEAGADDFLPKPFTPDELLAAIARWLPDRQ